MRSFTVRVLAAVLSFVLPGAGQIYNGQRHKALLGYSLFFLVPVLFILFKLAYCIWGLACFIVLLLCMYLWNVVDAYVHAARLPMKGSVKLAPWLVVVPAALFATNVYGLVRHLDPGSTILGLRPIRLMTNSMAPTVQAGEFFMLATRYSDAGGFERGRIVAFYHRSIHRVIFKRLIAVAGDTVEGKGTTIRVNGKKIHEPYAQYTADGGLHDDYNRRHAVNDFGPDVVPINQLFVLGDNRNHSFDSRDPEFGFVDTGDVYPHHKPLYIYWSPEGSRIGKTIE